MVHRHSWATISQKYKSKKLEKIRFHSFQSIARFFLDKKVKCFCFKREGSGGRVCMSITRKILDFHLYFSPRASFPFLTCFHRTTTIILCLIIIHCQRIILAIINARHVLHITHSWMKLKKCMLFSLCIVIGLTTVFQFLNKTKIPLVLTIINW